MSSTHYELNTPLNGKISIPTTTSTIPSTLTITPTTTHPTDIWRKPGPPIISTFNAPLLYRRIPLSKFQSVRVKISADWKGQYDQGGLVFILPNQHLSSEGTTTTEGNEGENLGKSSKWIKTGIEFYNGQPLVGTVARDEWADWSLYPNGIVDFDDAAGRKRKGVEILIERAKGDDTFWVFVVVKEDGEGKGEVKLPIREVTWVLSEMPEEREVWVGVYAATPNPAKEGEELEVRFEGLEFELRE